MTLETFLSFLIGIGLSASCGFRVFVPMLVMSIAAISGHLTLASGFQWIGTYPALAAFAVATAAEIGGYYIPYVDHLLDVIAGPASAVAGTLVMASMVTGTSPFLRWSLAIIAGGGVAAAIQTMTALVRAGSTITTGGLANPVVATLETGGSTLFSILAIITPLIALIAIAVCLALVFWVRRKRLGAKPRRPS